MVSWNSGGVRIRGVASAELDGASIQKGLDIFCAFALYCRRLKIQTVTYVHGNAPSNAVSQTFHQSGRAYLASVYTTGKVKRVCRQERGSSLLRLTTPCLKSESDSREMFGLAGGKAGSMPERALLKYAIKIRRVPTFTAQI